MFERGDQGILREFLGEADVAHQARDTGDDPLDLVALKPQTSIARWVVLVVTACRSGRPVVSRCDRAQSRALLLWPMRGGGALAGNRDRLFPCVAIEQKETADHFLGFGEGTVEQRGFAVAQTDAHCFVVGAQ